MANLPISGLTASVSNLAGTDVLPVVQTTGVGPVKLSGLQLAGGLLGSTALTGATITTSQPVLNLSQTWNAGAVTFTGLKFNATDTASASGSLLLDLQVGGTSKASVTKGGKLFAAAGISVGGASDVATLSNVSGWTCLQNLNGGNGVSFTSYNGNQATSYMNLTTNQVNLPVASVIGWSSAADATSTRDLFLLRAAAASLQLGAADAASPVAQTLQVQSVVAGTTNTAGTNFTIKGSAGTGTGAGGSIIFQVAPAGSSGTSQNALATALTIDSTKLATFANSIAVAGQVRSAGNVVLTSSSSWLEGYNNGFYIDSSNIIANQGAIIGFAAVNNSASNATDVILRRDAANTLALRNSTNPQLFRVYSTYTNNTTNAFGGIGAAINLDGTAGDANTLYIGSQKTGSPTALTKLALQVDGTTRLDYGITQSGSFAITSSNAGTNGVLFVQNNYSPSKDFLDCVTVIAGNNTTSGHRISFNLGVAQSLNNLATHFFKYVGSASTSNSFGVAFYGGSPVWEVTAVGNATLTGNLNFAGTTSSFPALKRSSTTLQVRLADDSANAALTCGTTTSSGTALNVTGTGDASILSVTNTTTGTLLDVVNSSGSSLLTVADTPAMTLIDAMTIAVGTTTGTKIGTATGQKIGFWNATPVAQQVLATGASKTVDDVITLLQTLGLCKQS